METMDQNNMPMPLCFPHMTVTEVYADDATKKQVAETLVIDKTDQQLMNTKEESRGVNCQERSP